MLKLSIILIYFFAPTEGNETIREEPEAVSYKGYQVYGVIPQTEAQLAYLHSLQNDTQYIKFWSEPYKVSQSVMVQVNPKSLVIFQRELKDRRMPFAVKINDLQRKIDNEKHANYPQMLFRVMGADAFDLGQYHSLEEINTYLELLSEQYPSITHFSSIGRSHEDREIKLFYIGTHNKAKEEKPAVVIDAGIHSREWIAPATALYLIKQLLTTNDSAIEYLRQTYDWYIIPVFNPDGYVHTWSTDRLWRKNRRKDPLSSCVGVDLNRNFDIGFSVEKSNHHCSDTFAGPQPFSEPETSALQIFVNSINHRLKIAFSLHSYGQVWVTSYVYKHDYPKYYRDLTKVLIRALDKAKQVNQSDFQFGPGALLMYTASGTSVDWYTEVANVKYAFIVELRDKGDHGFLLPKSQILPTGEETWIAIKDIAEHVSNLD